VCWERSWSPPAAEISAGVRLRRRARLDVRITSSRSDGRVRISGLTYASPKGGRVPALLFVPSGGGPYAGLIVRHGLPSSKEDVAFDAEELARLGAVVIAIDAPFARRRGAPIAFTRRDRTEQIQLIVDQRRAVDLLRARADVDEDRIAYLGVSYSAAMGGLLAGVEHRIAAFVLMSGDSLRRSWLSMMAGRDAPDRTASVGEASECTPSLSVRATRSARARARSDALLARSAAAESDPLVRRRPHAAFTGLV
jgi:dienelactone hydrolase